MGAEIIGAGILAGAGLLGTAATISTNKSNQSFSSAESEEARKWSTNERLAAQEYNTQERLATQEYNSVGNQVSQMRAAGINANVLSNGVSFHGSAPQSAQGASSGIAPLGNAQVPNIPQLVSSGADLVNAMSKNKETAANLPLINQQIEYLLQQTYGQEKANKLMDLNIQFEKANLPTKVKTALEQYRNLVIQNGIATKQGRVFDAQEKLINAQTQVQKMMKKLQGEQLIQAQFFNDNIQDIYNADMALKGAQTKKANAEAVQAGANARLSNASAESQELLNNISRATNLTDIDNALFNADTLVLLQQANNKQELWQQLERNIKKSSAYKNSEAQKKIDASIEKLRQILGINISAGVSASN